MAGSPRSQIAPRSGRGGCPRRNRDLSQVRLCRLVRLAGAIKSRARDAESPASDGNDAPVRVVDDERRRQGNPDQCPEYEQPQQDSDRPRLFPDVRCARKRDPSQINAGEHEARSPARPKGIAARSPHAFAAAAARISQPRTGTLSRTRTGAGTADNATAAAECSGLSEGDKRIR